MPILALPQTTIRAIGSSQVLTDSCSVVKELIDNALDARTSSIFVEISTNTTDVIQVTDNGHGIAPEDREMVCRRYCTSKLREYSDLRDVGARWLGFRGEALASAAEMAGALTVVTRVEGENVATSLKIGRMGEVQSQERASHPVGTTIRVSDFFKNLPVRKQTSLKASVKTLAKIKQTLQVYALARPAIRFSLRVMKAKNDKGNWTYAPNIVAGMADAALKVVGKVTAGECHYLVHTFDPHGSENSGEHNEEGVNEDQRQEGCFRIEAFLPRKDADPSKISGQGHYISIDSRPVSCTRGVLKQVLALYKSYIRSALSASSASRLVNPFICMNINCPAGSYDANVEPAKDDVLFEDSSLVLSNVESFLRSVYGELVAVLDDVHKVSESSEPGAAKPFDILLARKGPITDTAVSPIISSTAAKPLEISVDLDASITPILGQRPAEDKLQGSCVDPITPRPEPLLHEDDPIDSHRPPKRRRTWRFNMYGGDEEDIEDQLESNDQDQRPPTKDDQEALRDVGVNNPWIIAKMNAPVRPKQLDKANVTDEDRGSRNIQLLTPARDQGPSERLSAPFPRVEPSSDRRERQTFPTPERSYLSSSPLQWSADPTSQEEHRARALNNIVHASPTMHLQDRNHFADASNHALSLGVPERNPLRAPINDFVSARDLSPGTPLHEIPTAPARPPRKREPRKQIQPQSGIHKPFISPVHDPDNVWFPTDAPARRSKPPANSRAGTIRGAVDLVAPVRPDSEDEELLESAKARRQQSTKNADVEAALEYEHRKRAATKRHHSQLLLSSSGTLEKPEYLEAAEACLPATINSPHRNRYNAARAALKRPTPQPFTNTMNPLISKPAAEATRPSAFPEGDPRAYLMRVRRRSASHPPTNGGKASHGSKVKRTKTMLLPLESTPIESRTQATVLLFKEGIEGVEKKVRKAKDVERYVSGGDACGAFDGMGEDDVGLLEERLRGLLREGGWRLNEGDEEMAVDLREAFREHAAVMSLESA
ncbi:MAG: hypothetical protein M1812_006439 [Candelaria pacifica]|nr:MAG: hypothetical protein M1812_006439 [Candelaria pacifica]